MKKDNHTKEIQEGMLHKLQIYPHGPSECPKAIIDFFQENRFKVKTIGLPLAGRN